MKKRFKPGTILAILAGFVFSSCPFAKGNEQKITILFTNDLQAHLEPDRSGRGGLARISYLVKKIKSENPNTIFLDAGDASVGTAFATETRGEAVYRVMNSAGYDASVYGNHEFDLGAEQARFYQKIARFPILACNIREQNLKPFTKEYVIFEMSHIRIAVIGIAHPKTPNYVNPELVKSLNFLPPESEIRRLQTLLANKADIFILLSHQGLREDISLAYRIAGIPLIIGGHSESRLTELINVSGVSIAQAEHFGWWLGRIDLFFEADEKNLKRINYKLIKITDKIPEDPGVSSAILKEKELLPEELERVIGKTWFGLSKDFIGFWTAELIKSEGKAELGIINRAGVRSEIYRGEIKRMDIYEIMPFNDRIAVFEIDGKELLRLKSLGWFYFSRGPKISPGRIYKVASIDYLIKINDFPGAQDIQISEHLLRERMIERIEKDRGLKRFWEK